MSPFRIRHVDQAELHRLDEDGVVFLPKLIDGGMVAKLLVQAHKRMAAPGPYSSNMSKQGTFFEERNCYRTNDSLEHFTMTSGLSELAGNAMESSTIRLFMDHLFICEPNTPTEYYWHQDIPYWPIEGDQVCSVWIALTDCDRESAALEFVPGTHRTGLYGVREFGDAEDYDGVTEVSGGNSIPRYELEREKYGIIENNIQAGDAYLFNAKVMHASGGNRSRNRTRVAYSTRWAGDDIRWRPRDFGDDALLDAGKGLKAGDTLEKGQFPLIWRKSARG